MIDLTRIHSEALSTDPYRWAHIDHLFGPSDATALAASYPDQGFKTHAVSRVVDGSETSRRSVTVTFYKPGSVSTMWPPGEEPALHPYPPASS